MDEKRQSRVAPALIAAAVVLPMVLLVAYVAGYFWLSEKDEWVDYPALGASHQIDRSFKHRWMAELFGPASAVESLVLGVEVSVSVRSSDLR